MPQPLAGQDLSVLSASGTKVDTFSRLSGKGTLKMTSILNKGFTVIHFPFNTPEQQMRVELYRNGQFLATNRLSDTRIVDVYNGVDYYCISFYTQHGWYIFEFDDDEEPWIRLVKNRGGRDTILRNVRFIQVSPTEPGQN